MHDVSDNIPAGFTDSRVFDETGWTHQFQVIPSGKVAFDLLTDRGMFFGHSAVDIHHHFMAAVIAGTVDDRFQQGTVRFEYVPCEINGVLKLNAELLAVELKTERLGWLIKSIHQTTLNQFLTPEASSIKEVGSFSKLTVEAHAALHPGPTLPCEPCILSVS